MSDQPKKKTSRSFLVQGGILAVAGILVRIIGLAYRIPMTNIIGEEGIGVYQTAFSIYNILLLISSYSLPVAVSRLVSYRVSLKQYRNKQRVFHGALLFATITGVTMCLIAWFGADYFATHLMGMPEAGAAVKTLAPTILIMAFLGTLRGYFQGHGTMIPTAVSQIFEQIVNAAVSILACWILFNRGVILDAGNGDYYQSSYGAAGGTIGTGMGALTAIIFCILLYFCYRRIVKKQLGRDRTPEEKIESYSHVFRLIVLTIVPVLISTTVYQISLILDQTVFARYIGADYKTVWGIYSGKYNLLINVPVAFAAALASSVIPALSESIAHRNRREAAEKTGMAIRFNMIIAIPCAVGLAVLARPVMSLLFSGANIDAGMMMALGSSAVVFYSLSTITNSILQGIGNIWRPVRNAAISLVLHLILLAILLWGFRLGIYGVVFANIFFSLCMSVLNNLSVSRLLGYRQEWKKTFFMPLLCAGIMGAGSWLVWQVLHRVVPVQRLSTLITLIIAIAVYFALLFLTGTVTEEELLQYPKGDKFARFARKFHLLRGR